MTTTAEQRKIECIEQIAERVRQRTGPGEAEPAERLARQLYANVAPVDILGDSADNLAGAALALWGFARRRTPGEAQVRVYEPGLERDGWESTHTVVEIVNDDMPYLVDSVTAELDRLGAEPHLVAHPVVRVERGSDGVVTALHERGQGPEGAPGESFMHIHLPNQPEERHEEIRRSILLVLADVRAVYDDWKPMRERCREVVAELRRDPPPLPEAEISEGADFIQWIQERHFIFLGYREYGFEGTGRDAVAKVQPGTSRGLLRDEDVIVFNGLRNLGALPPDVRSFLQRPQLLHVTKTNRYSTVHKTAPMDAVAIKCFDPKGRVVGERLFIGFFTNAVYSASPSEIPILRQKVQAVFDRAGFARGSHNGKNLSNILASYPRDEVFQIATADLQEIAVGILYLLQRPRIALFARRDSFERFVSCLVLVPRERYDNELRARFAEILEEAFGGPVTISHTQVTDAALAWLLFLVSTTPGQIPSVTGAEVEKKLIEAGRTWADRLEEALVAARGEEEGLQAAHRYARAFPGSYQEHFDPQTAVFDIAALEAALASGDVAVHLYRPDGAEPHDVRLKIYGAGRPVPLSEVLPMLEDMGLRVIDEVPYDIRPAGLDQPAWIRDFGMETERRVPVDVESARERFQEAFGQVWRREIESDGLNKLVLAAALSARAVTVLRAAAKYLRQAGIRYSEAFMAEALACNPEIARQLAELFRVRFDPALREGADQRAAALLREIGALLDTIKDADQDRILRRFLNLVESVLRTNFYQPGPDGRAKGYLSFKLDSRKVEELPDPRPMVEVFVYSPRVEAIHLRGGKVARGGIRWSDRREDFRTEVLDLMKAQMVKNAVIVPVGSKGGFVVKRPPAPGSPRELVQQEGVECYKILMRGLLDLTDNLVDGKMVPPPAVVRRDGDDPYLVVAADKGTASFSDIANAMSAEYGFWLDDAFASGGSAGYDHKEMAITSRGAWESIKRHFREIGKDVEAQDFTVAGVGDMSGDVFGNGMLRSRHIRLVAAFDHRHVFLDPNPDPGRSFDERQRLADLPRSSWADYDPALLSEGGGVFERGARTIPVTPQVAALLGLAVEQVTPAEMIQAILKAPVELLFFGGIGTYVKSSEESHADAKDRGNDAQRVDAKDLRAAVIGEGANLAMTQRSRVEYAREGGPKGEGGRLNTDFIDNSAGVDCSDHEVNIKILLNGVEREGGLTREARNELLRSMTAEVADLVLRDNYLQTQAISVTHRLGHRLLDRQARFMRRMEREGRLNRKLEFLPDDDELKDRARLRTGFTRPELAVLLAYSKIVLYNELLDSDLPDDPFMQEDLKLYFPTPLRERFADQIARHRLRREIISTSVTNSIVNRTGPSFVHETKDKTGEDAADIARAYVITREVFRLRSLWAEIEALDNKVPAETQASMLTECGRLIDRGTAWFLREGGRPLDIGGQIALYAASVRELADQLDELMSKTEHALFAQHVTKLTGAGVPLDLARRIASLVAWLAPALDIVRVAREAKLAPLPVGRLYFRIGDRFGFDRLRQSAAGLPTEKAWDKLAVTALVDDLFGHQRDLTARVLASMGNGTPAERAVTDWAEKRRPIVTRVEQLLAEMQASGTPDLAMLAVANRTLKSLGA
jgi:glutamate dehydrogenase